MQTASSNFAAAVSASSTVWAPPQVRADWANDGYGGDGSIDDLSAQAGKPIVVMQALDDGMPSDVSTTTGKDATSTVTFPVGGRYVNGVTFTGPQYWSVDNTTSPLSAYDRDVAGLTISHGVVTAGGIERVTIFTGQMGDAPVTGRGVTVDGVSKTRLAMTKIIQPPGIDGNVAGLTATWPVVYALSQCGIYVSPPPRSGARWWSPMHGSIKEMAPTFQDMSQFRELLSQLSLSTGATIASMQRPTFVTGPYLLGVSNQLTTSLAVWTGVQAINLASGPDLISKAGNAGRVEFWIRGDAADTATSPPVVAFGSIIGLAAFHFVGASGVSVLAGVGTDRKVVVTVNDGTHTTTLKSSGTLPTDGAWYFIGAAWDVANNRLWTNLNGTASTSTFSPAMSTTGLPAGDDWYDGTAYDFLAYLPVAEVHLTAGAQANATNFPWLNDPAYTWTAGAVLSPSSINLVALAEPKPREAWEFVSSFAQAELAMVRTDELDRFCYLPMSYWAATAQQTVGDAWSTAVNVGKDFEVTRDPTKIRNQVTINYRKTQVYDSTIAVYVGFTAFAVPPGTSTFTAALGSPIAAVIGGRSQPLINMTAANVSDPTTVAAGVIGLVCINSAADGSGSYATSSQVSAQVTSWTPSSITVTFTNVTGATWYVSNGGISGLPYIQLGGFFASSADASVTVNDTASQSARGLRGMSVSLPAIQDAGFATTIAQELLARTRKPRPELHVTLRGDPRRQPGDLVTFTDPSNTKLGGTWRVLSIDHHVNGSGYTQDVIATKAWLVGVWDQSLWDDAIWGP